MCAVTKLSVIIVIEMLLEVRRMLTQNVIREQQGYYQKYKKLCPAYHYSTRWSSERESYDLMNDVLGKGDGIATKKILNPVNITIIIATQRSSRTS